MVLNLKNLASDLRIHRNPAYRWLWP